MMYRYTHTRLIVSDVVACLRFYREVLGFEPTFGADGKSDYVEFDTGEVRLSLYDRKLMNTAVGTPNGPVSGDRVLLSIFVDSVDAAYHDLMAKGITFVMPPADRPTWGLRTAHFRDPDGNLIEINHDISIS